MRKKFIEHLIDPVNSKKFELNIFTEENNHVVSGILYNAENWYPIINGIPRLLINELRINLLQSHHAFFKEFKNLLSEKAIPEWQSAINKISDMDSFLNHQKKTGESFAYEWKNIYKENDFEKQNFLHFLSPFINESFLKDKVTVDIGCGSGRFTKWAALCGAKIAIGTDLGESVDVAYRLTRDLENTCIVQADIYNMPFKDIFDIAYSIGVLHHLPKPQEGFSRLPEVLKIGGKMLIWVYSRRNNKRALYFYEPLRYILKKLPKSLLFKLCYIPGAIVHILNYSTHFCNFIGVTRLAKKMPFAYYASFPFNMKLNDAFDVLATPKSNYYYKEEIEKWFQEANLKEIKSFEHPEAGITCIGNYE